MRSVLLVEDDIEVAQALTSMLSRYGYAIAHAANGDEALSHFSTADIVLLDLGLPDIDGLELCRRLREASSVPIVVLTARSEEIDKVLALRMGADDYVVKPYGFQELLARIEAVLRRTTPAVAAVGSLAPGSAVEFGDVSIDRASRKVFVGGVETQLTKKEFGLLDLLAENLGVVISRHDLLTKVWGDEWVDANRTLDVHISSLRQKLGPNDHIEVVRGVGYRLKHTR